MSIEKKATQWLSMSDSVWEKHTSPWSVWTRYSGLPLLALAIWSRVWIGWWSVLPIIVVLIWIWLNPRLFRKPQSTHYWASQAVLGERIWLDDTQAIPIHHIKAINVLKLIMTFGTVLTIYGLIVLHVYLTLLGIVIVILGKSWFLDRMVWLYQETQNTSLEN